MIEQEDNLIMENLINVCPLTEVELVSVDGGKNLLEYVAMWVGDAAAAYMNSVESTHNTPFGHYGGARP
jgi:hypothetical protein